MEPSVSLDHARLRAVVTAAGWRWRPDLKPGEHGLEPRMVGSSQQRNLPGNVRQLRHGVAGAVGGDLGEDSVEARKALHRGVDGQPRNLLGRLQAGWGSRNKLRAWRERCAKHLSGCGAAAAQARILFRTALYQTGITAK